MKPFRFADDARRELDAALEWYETRFTPGSSALLDAVENGIRRIQRHPRASPTMPGDLESRAMVLPRLGYSIVYREEDDEIVILAIAHQRRRAGYWAGRHGRK